MSQYRSDGEADFQLYLADKPQVEDPRSIHRDYVSMPIRGLPVGFNSLPKESKAVSAIKWAKEKGMSESLDKALTDVVHWVTVSHIGFQGAGQMGLNTFDMVLPDFTPLACLPAFGLPSLPDQSFLDATLDLDALELPSIDSSLANVDWCSMDTADLGVADLPVSLDDVNLDCVDMGVDQLNGDDLATAIADMGFA